MAGVAIFGLIAAAEGSGGDVLIFLGTAVLVVAIAALGLWAITRR